MKPFKSPLTAFIVVTWVLTVVCVAFSLTFVAVGYDGIWAYVVYLLSALTLAYTVYTIVKFGKRVKKDFINLLKRNKFAKALMENYNFRTLVFALVSLVINVGFVLLHSVYAITSDSIWYGASAGYYFLLVVLKGVLFSADNKAKKLTADRVEIVKWKNYRGCGIFLFVLELAMALVVLLMVLEQKPTAYSNVMAIALAAFTCYKVTFAIINVQKSFKNDDVLIKSFRNIGLAEAGVSLLSLQTALVSTFGDANEMLTLNAITGFAVCVLTMVMGVMMTVHSTKKIRKLSDEKPQ